MQQASLQHATATCATLNYDSTPHQENEVLLHLVMLYCHKLTEIYCKATHKCMHNCNINMSRNVLYRASGSKRLKSGRHAKQQGGKGQGTHTVWWNGLTPCTLSDAEESMLILSTSLSSSGEGATGLLFVALLSRLASCMFSQTPFDRYIHWNTVNCSIKVSKNVIHR